MWLCGYCAGIAAFGGDVTIWGIKITSSTSVFLLVSASVFSLIRPIYIRHAIRILRFSDSTEERERLNDVLLTYPLLEIIAKYGGLEGRAAGILAILAYFFVDVGSWAFLGNGIRSSNLISDDKLLYSLLPMIGGIIYSPSALNKLFKMSERILNGEEIK